MNGMVEHISRRGVQICCGWSSTQPRSGKAPEARHNCRTPIHKMKKPRQGRHRRKMSLLACRAGAERKRDGAGNSWRWVSTKMARLRRWGLLVTKISYGFCPALSFSIAASVIGAVLAMPLTVSSARVIAILRFRTSRVLQSASARAKVAA